MLKRYRLMCDHFPLSKRMTKRKAAKTVAVMRKFCPSMDWKVIKVL